MPTGYTAAIAEGITFRQYAMSCARAFGALIEMRDEPQNAEIPEAFEASKYYKDAIEKEAMELKEMRAMDHATVAAKAKEAHQKRIDYHTEQIAKNEALAAKYKSMLEQVEAYKSPSPAHNNFKEFMRNQIRESIKFDCGGGYHERAIAEAQELGGPEWVESEKQRLEQSIASHRKLQAEEDERNRGRNEWLRKLRESLK